MQRLFWIDLPGNVYCPLSKLIKCGLAIIRFMTLYGCTCPFALNVVFLHDPGPFLSRCIISVKCCFLGILKASFYKGNESCCVLVEQKLTSVKFRRFTLNVVTNDQRNESQRNSNIVDSCS